MKHKVEFIESYIKIGNDYKWNDNHGELIRCKDCKHWKYEDSGIDGTAQGECCSMHILSDGTFYCAGAERKEHGTDRMDCQP